MRNILYLTILIVFIASCKGGKQDKDRQVITVTILPQKFIVEQIAGNTFPVNVILPPGASPEHYEPTPKQLQDLNQSFIYFYVGHLGFEKPWMKKFYDSAPNVDYISCSKGIDLLEGGHEHCSADDHDHAHRHGTDPHIWTSPENVKTMSKTIFNELKSRFPEKEVEFKANLDLFISRIDSLDFYIRETFADIKNNDFMIFHPSLGYYAYDYHLNQHSIEYEGKSPSAAHIRRMVDLSREKGINTIFYQTQFESEKAEAIAREINAEMVIVDPLAEDWLKETYSITDKLKKSFDR